MHVDTLRPGLTAIEFLAPILIALIFISLCSMLKEPNKRDFMALMIAGAGAAYLNGGLGKWEFVFTAVVTWSAYKGLHSYGFIGFGWDVVHHLHGNPIVPFAPSSSLGCAICDRDCRVVLYGCSFRIMNVFDRRVSPDHGEHQRSPQTALPDIRWSFSTEHVRLPQPSASDPCLQVSVTLASSRGNWRTTASRPVCFSIRVAAPSDGAQKGGASGGPRS